MGSLEVGGAEKVLTTVLNNFDSNKYELELCLINKKGNLLSVLTKNIKIISLYKQSNSLLTKIEHRIYRHLRISFFEKLRIRLKIKKKYDVIISFLEGNPLKFHNYIIGRAKKNITWVHIDMFLYHKTTGYNFSEKHELEAYKNMDEIVFVSKMALNQFKKRFMIDAKYRVIYNPIDCKSIMNFAKTEEVKKEKFTICSIGRLVPQKAFERFLRVAKKLKDDGYNIDYWLIGDGPQKAELNKLRLDLDLEKEFRLLGLKNPPYQWLSKADIFISTSLVEGYSLVICEALCLGIPVVATKCTGPIEILQHNKYGILTEQDDESIYKNLKSLLNDKKLLKHYQEKAKEGSTNFDVKKTMKEIYSIL